MTTIDTHPESAVAVSGAASGTGTSLTAVAAWVTTTDHKRIGRLFVGFGLTFMLGIGTIGALLGFERVDTNKSLLDSNALTQLFSLYRVGLAFMVVLPLILGLAVAIVPAQIGSKAMAFPRACALGLWTWLGGSGLLIAAYAQNGGPGGGKSSAVDLFLAALGLSVIGLIITAATLAATVMTSRAPGMTMERTPAFAWAALVASIALILVLPVLLAALIYLFVDHRFGPRLGIADNQGFGGNAIYPWIRFALSQPQSFVYAIPVLGLVAEVVPVFAKRRMLLRGAMLAGVGVFATAALAGVSQVDHTIEPWSAISGSQKFKDILPYALFNLLPLLGLLIVMGAVTLTLLSAVKERTLKFSAPLVFALAAAGMLTIGVAAHALTPISDLQLSGTVYEEGVFTFIAYAVVLSALGALAYWGPKLWGRKLPTLPLVGLALLGTLAVLATSVPYLIAGFNNQPGLFGVDTADKLVSGWTNQGAPKLMNALNGIGHGLMVLTVLGFVFLALRFFIAGPRAGDDPWDGHTLEWATASPAPTDNFVDVPFVASAEPLVDLKPAGSDA